MWYIYAAMIFIRYHPETLGHILWTHCWKVSTDEDIHSAESDWKEEENINRLV